MTIRDLLGVLDAAGLAPVVTPTAAAACSGLAVSGVAYDSRLVGPGAVFVAIRGEQRDGVSFAHAALAAGAVAVVAACQAPDGLDACWIRVSDDRLALAVLADWVFGSPSRALRVVGITGTNGKTTTSYLVRAILEAAGEPCGLIGTVHYGVGGALRDAPRTTPESVDLQAMFRDMVNAGTRACAMEVSSHALVLKRVETTRFAAAVLTNLTRDHLDFHGDMDRYFAAKQHLFFLRPDGAPGIVNADDAAGRALAASMPRVSTYGVRAAADVYPTDVVPSLSGLRFTANTPHGSFVIQSRLMGTFNLYNLLAAVATGVALNVPPAAIAEGLAGLTAVPGRLQVVSDEADDITVVVDYAHTDDALRNILEAVRPLVTGRLVTVFGCGGDRDRTKRPLMGAVAHRLSDRVIVTSDNPRSEDPEAILDDIERGLPASDGSTGQAWTRQTDRRVAITQAIDGATAGDVVVIAGKGHERYQIIGSVTVPFDDVAEARTALGARRIRLARAR